MNYDDIMERMLSNVPDSYDKREGSIIWDALSPCAIELNNLYMEFENMQSEAYGDTASREYLIRLGAERGLTPYPATKAVLRGVFTPSSLSIPIGSRFNSSVASYAVTEYVADGIYKLECETAGTVGNSYSGAIIPIDYIEGLETARIESVLIYGEDDEETEHFRTRYMTSFDERSFSGNRKDYIEKCVAIAGVGACKVEAVWNGGGTVRLTILDSEYGTASEELITKVKNYFDPNSDGQGDGVAPIGHVVTVRSAASTTVNVTTTITFDSSYSWSTHRTLIENAVKSYLLGIRQTWQDESNIIVRISQLESRILNIDGITDITGTMINGSAENLVLDEYTVPIFGGVNNET